MNNVVCEHRITFHPDKIEKYDDSQYQFDPKEWEKSCNVHKIKYEVGDECVFEITKGDKKWTISLDDFFDKVIQICGEKKDD